MIFLDTSFLFPLFARHDPDHQRVREVMEGYRGKRMADQVLTTSYVVAETITLVRYKGSRQSKAAHALATEVGSALYAGTLARIQMRRTSLRETPSRFAMRSSSRRIPYAAD